VVNNTWSIETLSINGPEGLRESTRGSDVQAVQLRPGKLRGSITHLGIGNLGISLGRFDCGIRTRGPLHQEKVVLGTILASKAKISHWWKDVKPGDVGIIPPSVETDAIYCSGGAYAVVSIALPDLLSMLIGEDRLADPALWSATRLCHPDHLIGNDLRRSLKGVMSSVERKRTAPSAQAADFLQRTIIEGFVVSLASTLPPDRGQSCNTGARLVSETEDYVDAADGRPVHISELCSALKVSRRSLHRAFANTLGMGPVAYLRRRRLSEIQSVLKRSDPATVSIGDLAFEYGFPEPSRFATYYRVHFGERPSETCRSASLCVRTVR
jgi:AraC family ethanolamine operon transcriptional activator